MWTIATVVMLTSGLGVTLLAFMVMCADKKATQQRIIQLLALWRYRRDKLGDTRAEQIAKARLEQCIQELKDLLDV